jgi:vacuolar-type H+-ATPase subunit C/Vma6
MTTVRYDVTYTNGVIASREKYLLKEKLYRLCELSAVEAFRVLLESGFGGGAETASTVYEFEKLIAEEEMRLDAFIREYAPSKAEANFLLAYRDFHNAKAMVKAEFLGESVEKMLAPSGFVDCAFLQKCVKEKEFALLSEQNSYLATACKESIALLQEEPSGAKVGAVFEKALYSYLHELLKGKRVLRKLLSAKADMTNILTAFRATDREDAQGKYLPAGTLNEKALSVIFSDEEAILRAFKRTEYEAFVRTCLEAKSKGLPCAKAEKMRDGYETAFFAERKYELSKNEPFLYYVYRRKAEISSVRITFVCLLAGMNEQEIKRRLRVL